MIVRCPHTVDIERGVTDIELASGAVSMNVKQSLLMRPHAYGVASGLLGAS